MFKKKLPVALLLTWDNRWCSRISCRLCTRTSYCACHSCGRQSDSFAVATICVTNSFYFTNTIKNINFMNCNQMFSGYESVLQLGVDLISIDSRNRFSSHCIESLSTAHTDTIL